MIARLKELKEIPNSSTWLKDHVSVFSDSQQLGGQNIFITEDEKLCEKCTANTSRVSSTTFQTD